MCTRFRYVRMYICGWYILPFLFLEHTEHLTALPAQPLMTINRSFNFERVKYQHLFSTYLYRVSGAIPSRRYDLNLILIFIRQTCLICTIWPEGPEHIYKLCIISVIWGYRTLERRTLVCVRIPANG